MIENEENIIVKAGDNNFAVEDVQRRLAKLGFLKESNIDCIFGDITANAVKEFCKKYDLEEKEYITDKIWAKLVDATFKLGDRNLYLSMPYFHGNDVYELQKALGTLGFALKKYDGIFGVATERAVRRFQINMGLPSDGIVGSQTFATLKNLAFTWEDKEPVSNAAVPEKHSIWREADVLENNSICLFGTCDFTRDVASRMSNLARATNPFSKVLNSESYSVAPSADTLLLQIILPKQQSSSQQSPRVLYHENDEEQVDEGTNQPYEDNVKFIARLSAAIPTAMKLKPPRMTIELPGKMWWDAGEDRSAQHFAITILDALCSALDNCNK